MKKQVLVVTILFVLLFVAGNAHADLIWHWEFDENPFTPGPTDTVVLNATLFNDISSDEDITWFPEYPRIDSTGLGYIDYGFYHYESGPAGGDASDFWNQFRDLDVAPGDSFSFAFGHFIPEVDAVPVGFNFSGDARIFMNMGDGSYNPPFEMAYWSILVTDHSLEPPPEPPIPEPASLVLLGLGLTGIILKKRVQS